VPIRTDLAVIGREEVVPHATRSIIRRNGHTHNETLREPVKPANVALIGH
jgi:hypothetical protein